jgi:predicted dithiol-disulfide oxidoreductase (DUF899 family)
MNDITSRVVDRKTWLEARRALLEREKALTHEHDALAAARRALPLVETKPDYPFEEGDRTLTLRDLFGDKRQLVVYHFMFDPSWEAGCKSCSFTVDHLDGAAAHLAARDTAFVAVSRAPWPKLAAFRERMGWSFRWVSSSPGSFNADFAVSFRDDEIASKTPIYNFGTQTFPIHEAHGLSVFVRDGERVLHAYSTYGRGVDALMGTYTILDFTPLGRQEEGLPFPMAWIRHHDAY